MNQTSNLTEVFARYLDRVDYFNSRWLNPNTTFYVAKLMEECGEVAEACVATMYASETKREKILKSGQTPHQRLEEELGDAMNILITLAHVNHLDMNKVLEQATAKIDRRIDKKEKATQP